ncbi:Lrp/AsnC family transcriptional regulator [Gordonia sp. CPCC 205515]|uniref:hypothetical protein n=1 Tax=Gordonia sp. CPCC 205515 TaxID=3140791 RepID=UPI003AF36B77
MQELTPTDDESRLIHALQIWPRAPWSQLGPILAADPVTLARRWSGLTDRGLAWVTAQPPLGVTARGAVIEVECAAGSIDSVSEALALDAECVSIDVGSGGRDLILTAAFTTPEMLTRYVISRVGGLAGVRTVRAHPVVKVVAAAAEWRLRALDATEVGLVEAARERDDGRRGAPASGSVADREVVSVLSRDGRATTRDIADALGIPVRRARERLSATLAAGGFDLRTDMPRWASGYPVCAWYFARVPAVQLASVGAILGNLPAVRTVLTVAGPANMLMSVWLRDLADIEGLEAVIEQKLPAVSIVDRCLVLGVRKRMGRVFDEQELPAGIVPWRA